MIGLELILKMNNLSFKELADKLGITKQNVSMWVSGERKIPKKYLPILSEMFSCQIEYLNSEINDVQDLNINKTSSSDGETRIGMTGLNFIRHYYFQMTKNISKELGVDVETFTKWERGLEQIPNDKLNELSRIYNVDKEFIIKDLYHNDYIALSEILFKNDVKNGRLVKNKNIKKEVSDEKIELLSDILNSFQGKKIYVHNKTHWSALNNTIEFLTSYLFSEGAEKLFILKDKYSKNSISFLAANIQDVRMDANEKNIIIIYFSVDEYLTISTIKQDIDFI